MEDEIVCSRCHKRNGIQKFCMFCGQKLLEDNEIRLLLDNQEPYCLNCGRLVKDGQKKCECGYEFHSIKCPDCNSKNSYENRFCTSCGKKLWTAVVYDYNYPERLFEKHFLNERLPVSLRNTSLYQRPQMNFEINYLLKGVGYFKSKITVKSKINEYLWEICSRWKVVSPHYCISCISISDPKKYYCTKCARSFADRKRVDYLQSENKYVEPKFTNVELKWTPKFSNNYLNSLAPAIGESQFEYRERLKWEFSENNYHKQNVINAIIRKQEEIERKRYAEKRKRESEKRKRESEEAVMVVKEFIRRYGGGFCGSNCIHYYEEIIDNKGGVTADYTDAIGVFHYCRLGYSVAEGHYCQYFE